MPTKTPTLDELRAEAQRAQGEADRVAAEAQRAAEARLEAFDRAELDAVSQQAIDAPVKAAQEALRAAVLADPVHAALIDLLVAERSRFNTVERVASIAVRWNQAHPADPVHTPRLDRGVSHSDGVEVLASRIVQAEALARYADVEDAHDAAREAARTRQGLAA